MRSYAGRYVTDDGREPALVRLRAVVSRDGLSTFALPRSAARDLRGLLVVADRPGVRHEPAGDEPRLGADVRRPRQLRDESWRTRCSAIAVRNTAYFALLALVFGFPIPIILAVIMSEARRGRGLLSALAYLPVVVPPVVSVLLWRFFYDASPNGVFNTLLGWVGLGPLPWLQNATSAMPSLVLEATWAAAGATVIIYLAALLSVPPELYDAAEVDGASIWQKIWHVTLPQLRGVLFVLLILQLIATAQLFTEPFLFTGGGPANSTTTVLLLIYHYAFQNSLGGEYGMAAALSVMLAAFLALFTAGYFWLTRSWSTSS